MEKILAITIMIVIAGIASILIFAQEEAVILTPNVFAQDYEIPAWIKNNANWWATNQIDDSSFMLGIQYLIKEEIMVIPSTETAESTGSQEVPSWIKNTAGWWAEGQIDDSSFVLGIQWLISNGIIVVEEKLIHTDVDLRVAFIADQGNTVQSIAVLNLIKNEGAQMVLHQGDFDYNDDPDAWDRMISNVLGDNFPYFASIGHHDVKAWDGYQEKLYDRLKKNPDATCNGNLGVKSSCTYKGLFFILAAPGDYANDSDYNSFIEKQLNNNDHIWRVCSWHNDMYAMQLETEPNETGFEVYESCKNGGAFIASSHWHFYARSNTLINIENHITDPEWPESNKLRVEEGATFIFISGLGGNSVTAAKKIDIIDPDVIVLEGSIHKVYDEWPINYTADQSATYGALFCTFNVGGQLNKAYCYFKNIDGVIIDTFTITSFLGTHPDSINLVDVDMSGKDLTGNDYSNTVIIDTNLSNAILVDVDLSNTVLIGTTLTKTDLTGANLTSATLTGMDLSDTILRGADLTGANLFGATLTGMDLSDTILRGADLTGANLIGVDLSGMDLTGTILRGADLTGANLIGVDLSGMDLTDTILRSIDLTSMNLTGTILRGADLTGANLTGATFTGMDLTYANLSGLDLSAHDLTDVILTGADLSNSVLPDNGLSGKNFVNTIFNGVDLSGKDLSYSDFKYASFKNTNLKNANLSLAKLIEVDLTKIKNKSLAGANLFNTVISYSNLSGINLDRVNLAVNNFRNTNFSGVDFTVVSGKFIEGVIWSEADLSDANFEGIKFINKNDLGQVITYKVVLKGKAYLSDKSLHELSIELLKLGSYSSLVVRKQVIGNDLALEIIRYNHFGKANLQNVNFSNADLTFSFFIDADLINANLSNADLVNTFLINANLTGAILTGADLENALLNNAILNCVGHPICIS